MKKSYIIALVVVIFILSFTTVEINKQNNEQSLAESKLQIERDKMNYQKEQDRKAEANKIYAKAMISACIADAENDYWNFMELNGTGKRDDKNGVSAATRFWDAAKKDKETAIDNCYRKYNN